MEPLDDLMLALLDEDDDQMVRALLVGSSRELRQLEEQVSSLVEQRLTSAS